MNDSMKRNLRDILKNIKSGSYPSALFLGQKYFKKDTTFYKKVLQNFNADDDISWHKLWEQEEEENKHKELSEILLSAGKETECHTWFRSIMNMNWNIVVSSCVNTSWMNMAVGSNFDLQSYVLSEIKFNFYTYCNGKKMITFANEENFPSNRKELKEIKGAANDMMIPEIYKGILNRWGIIVADGIENDDWMKLPDYLSYFPDECIYIFGTTRTKLEDYNKDLCDYIGTKLILIEESLPEVLEELDMVEKDEKEPVVYSNSVRITLPDGDTLWLDRNDITRFENMGITVMRDEILGSLFVDSTNIEKYFADFLLQRDRKQWHFFNVKKYDEKEKDNNQSLDFHVKRSAEDKLVNYITEQSEKPTRQRKICLLSGNSNTGKTTSLSWLAWRIFRNFPETGKKRWTKGGYVVYYISGNPENQDKNWEDSLIDFVKSKVNNQLTSNGKKIKNNIIIWDNYDIVNRIMKYTHLFVNMNECNPMLIGSSYSFENGNVIHQDVGYERIIISDTLNTTENSKFNQLLKNINKSWQKKLENQSRNLFEILMDFSKLKYSIEWQNLRINLKTNLQKEADITEENANKIYQDSKKLGIGAPLQLRYEQLDDDRKEKNKPLINAITLMNEILACSSQFNNQIEIPISLLLRVIDDDKNENTYIPLPQLTKILKNDSMVRYKQNVIMTNVSCVFFRNPSEAISYLDKFGKQLKDKEISILLQLLRHCQWSLPEEARAVLGLVRAFGPNSYGKYGEEPPARGNYEEYQPYWNTISDELGIWGCGNLEAVMVMGQFIREDLEYKETLSDNSKREILFKYCNDMINELNSYMKMSYISISEQSIARMSGEICRNIIKQIEYMKSDQTKELQNLFKTYFKIGKEHALKCQEFSKISSASKPFSTIQFLDIWLKYVTIIKNFNENDYYQLIPDTISYIDIFFYSNNNDPESNYQTVIKEISDFYGWIGQNDYQKIKNYFDKLQNDSYIYYMATRPLIELYIENKDIVTNFEDKNGYNLTRLFFLNEYSSCKDNEFEEHYNRLKRTLREKSKDIIDELEKNTKMLSKSPRCLLLYLRAKWMYYTGNFILEIEQKPKLSESQWKELNGICSSYSQIPNKDTSFPSAMAFITNVYSWVNVKDYRWDNQKIKGDRTEKVICLCDADGIPLQFQVSTQENNKKVYAEINKEKRNSVWMPKTLMTGKKHILFPDNIRDYQFNRSKKNITTPYSLWFSLSGPLLQDIDKESEET